MSIMEEVINLESCITKRYLRPTSLLYYARYDISKLLQTVPTGEKDEDIIKAD